MRKSRTRLEDCFRKLWPGLRGRASAGFTLLEIIVAMGILLVALIPTLAAMTGGIRSIGSGNQLAEASYLLQQAAEEVKAAAAADEDFYSPGSLEDTVADYAGSGLDLLKTIEDVPDSSNLKRVTLELKDAREQSLGRLIFLVYKGGI